MANPGRAMRRKLARQVIKETRIRQAQMQQQRVLSILVNKKLIAFNSTTGEYENIGTAEAWAAFNEEYDFESPVGPRQ